MALLIDPPCWPAHGTVFSHLVSDASLAELHRFAAAAGLPAQAFDYDHYDVPERLYSTAVALGARPVAGSELIRRLIASGLRTRPVDRAPKRHRARVLLRRSWDALLPDRRELSDELIARWSEPHRRYHDVRHLVEVLAVLDRLAVDHGPAVSRSVVLAAWFHDAVYDGDPGADEERSALLAEELLGSAGLPAAEVADVARLVRLTAGHRPEASDLAGGLLCDADLAILGRVPGRYDVYARDVRIEHRDVPEELFRSGRLAVLDALLAQQALFATATARDLWERQARVNLATEHATLTDARASPELWRVRHGRTRG